MAEGAESTAVVEEEPPVVPPERASAWARISGTVLRLPWASILIVALALGVFFTAANPNFGTRANLLVVAQFTAVTAIIAAGDVMLMICSEIVCRHRLRPGLVHHVLHLGRWSATHGRCGGRFDGVRGRRPSQRLGHRRPEGPS